MLGASECKAVPDVFISYAHADRALAELREDPRFEQSRQQILSHLRKERRELGNVTVR